MPIKAKKASSSDTKLHQWCKIFNPQIIIATLICVLCIIMAVVCFIKPGTKDVSVTSPVKDLEPLTAITPKDRVSQTFTSDDDYNYFGLYYANYFNYTQNGRLHIDVEDDSGAVSNFSYVISGVIDTSFLYVDYPLQKSETYKITIHVTDDAQGITFFTTTSDNNYSAELHFNKKREPATIIMAFVTEERDVFNAWYYVMIFTLSLCYIIVKVDKDAYVKKAQ